MKREGKIIKKGGEDLLLLEDPFSQSVSRFRKNDGIGLPNAKIVLFLREVGDLRV